MNKDKPKKKIVKVYADIVSVYKSFAKKYGIKDYGILINRVLIDNIDRIKNEDPLIIQAIEKHIYEIKEYECDHEIRRISRKINFKNLVKRSLMKKSYDCISEKELVEYIDAINVKAMDLKDDYVKQLLDAIKTEIGFCKNYRQVRRKVMVMLGGKREHEQLPPPDWKKDNQKIS